MPYTPLPDALGMMFLCLCLGKPTAANNKPESLFVDCKMSFKQFMHGLRQAPFLNVVAPTYLIPSLPSPCLIISIVGNPADKAALKAAM